MTADLVQSPVIGELSPSRDRLFPTPVNGSNISSRCCTGSTGWYDGSEWYKPPDVRARDELLNTYEVKPVVDRLKM